MGICNTLTIGVLITAGSGVWAETRCDAMPFDGVPEAAEAIATLSTAFNMFPVLEQTLTDGISAICIVDRMYEARAAFEPETRRLYLEHGLPIGLRQAVLIHEIRHAQQYKMDVCPSINLSMQNYAQAVFAMEADASVTGLVVADFLRDQGRPDMWNALENWPMQADIAAVYDAARAQGQSISASASHAFNAWYRNDKRREAYYIATCLDYLDQSEDQHLLPRYGSLDTDFFNTLCQLPDGRAYPCAAPE